MCKKKRHLVELSGVFREFSFKLASSGRHPASMFFGKEHVLKHRD